MYKSEVNLRGRENGGRFQFCVTEVGSILSIAINFPCAIVLPAVLCILV